MNPIEKDLKNYFGVEYGGENDILEHYGTKRHSGRYPWGSGETPYQHSGDFLSRVEKFKAKGMSEGEILDAINDTLPPEYKLGVISLFVFQRFHLRTIISTMITAGFHRHRQVIGTTEG